MAETRTAYLKQPLQHERKPFERRSRAYFWEMFLQRFVFYFSSGYYRDLMIIPLPGFIAINVIVVLVFIP